MFSRILPNLRMAGGLTLLCFAAMLAGSVIGLFPDTRQMRLRQKTMLSESLAISCSLMAQRKDFPSVQENLRATVERNRDVLSAALRDNDGSIVVSAGDHEQHWRVDTDEQAEFDSIFLPIIDQSGKDWGQIEVAFVPDKQLGLFRLLDNPFARFATFVCVTCFLSYVVYLLRILAVLNPANVVPQRVRSALDTLTEGLVILDSEQRITLTNRAFEANTGSVSSEFIGKRLDEVPGFGNQIKTCLSTVRSGLPAKRAVLRFHPDNAETEKTFLFNATPIRGDDGEQRGVLASFEDITELESQKRDLQAMLARLSKSRDHIQQQNVALMRLATTDSLTNCLNRRTFFEQYHDIWKQASAQGRKIHCAMVDIDFFKSINDQYGHSTGDEVLRDVAATLRHFFGEPHLVCRYGGEEFCILIMTDNVDQAMAIAEQVRQAIKALKFEGMPGNVTASLGVSSMTFGANGPQDMLDQADKSLYVAKRSGRDQVVSWQDVPKDIDVDETKVSRVKADSSAQDNSIPFSAVACLLSALAYRDADTASHSRRVADLVFAMAREQMSLKDSYVVEIAALLHDIGKIGVPDSILLKPDKLTEEEWKIMCLHDRIGVEIVAAAFVNKDLVDIIHCHHAKYSGTEGEDLPSGKEIPLGARILAVADAYDAMVSDRVYRRGMPVQDALAELKRCAGTHFDPDVVNDFVRMIDSYQPNSLESGSKQAAIQMGIQVESLAEAMDKKDVEGIRAIAAHLGKTAAKYRLSDVQQVAEDIEALAADDSDMVQLVDSALSLVDLCRATRTSYTDVPDTRASVRPPNPVSG